MAHPGSPSPRFRSATDFPKTIQALDSSEADAIYREMRECLIFTNRSRSQLVRRNEEHKAKANLLRQDVARLQAMMSQLTCDKQAILQENRGIVSALETEISTMATRLDELSIAFGAMDDIETSVQAQWSYISFPQRFFRFLNAVRAVVVWWNSERPEERSPLPPSSRSEVAAPAIEEEEDRRDRPQMYTDQASVGRSLLDR
jgi:hypothetical protein